MQMQVQLVPLGSVQIGPASWRDATLRSVQRAQRLVRLVSRSAGSTQKVPSDSSAEPRGDEVQQEERGQNRVPVLAPFPPSGLRERCAAESVAVAGEYMRRVREVEARLRRQAGTVAEEAVKLQRERVHLEKTLRSIRTNLSINGRSSESRSRRPATAETERDGADQLLRLERRELMELKRDLEAALEDAVRQQQVLGESSRKLLLCARERARVLDLVPPSCPAGPNVSTVSIQPEPFSHFTPECKQVLESSSLAVRQSQLLREKLRRSLSGAITRQNAAHRSVNDGLVKKIAETISLQWPTWSRCSETLWRTFSCFMISEQGPESSGDVPSREKLDRPLVQVYRRHPGTQLPEAARLCQGSAALRRCLQASEAELLRLQRSGLQLLEDLRGKSAAAQVDASVVRMRRQQVDKRATPAFLQQGAC
uniref:Tektin like 1 n=1 Tax=Fundulus heteroclitus TaxID=8078 RepID=A0A3Q2QK33_FUNHE